MIGKDHSYPTGRYISQESSGELDDGYVRNVAHVAAVIKSGCRFSSGCCRGFFLGLLFRRRLAGLVCPFLSVFSLSCRYNCQVSLSSENTSKQIVLFPCAEQNSELQVINFIDTGWKKMLMRVQGCEKIEISKYSTPSVGKFPK